MNKSVKELKILVIGATGAGKSSLVNLFYYWSTKSDLSSLFLQKKALIQTKYFQGDGEAEGEVMVQGQSQTNFSKIYQFELEDPKTHAQYSVSFMDTPGIGDTRGREKDDENIQDILNSISKTEDLNAIILMLNGSESRISPRIQAIVTKLKTIIPDSLLKNLIILLSNVDLKPSLDIRALGFDTNSENVYYYNNQIFNLDPKHFSNKNLMIRVNQTYQESIDTISALLSKISVLPSVKTTDFMEIKVAQDTLKKELNECRETICQLLEKRNYVADLLKEVQEDNFSISSLYKQQDPEIEIDDFDAVSTYYINTNCQTCKKTCHEKCAFEFEKGSVDFKKCAAFYVSKRLSNDICQFCGHLYTSHIHSKELYTQKKKKVLRYDEKIQEQIKNFRSQKNSKMDLIESLQFEAKDMDEKIELLQNKIIIKILEMREVCSRFDYIKQIESCITIIREQAKDIEEKLYQKPNSTQEAKLRVLYESEKMMEDLKNKVVDLIKENHNKNLSREFLANLKNESLAIDQKLCSKEKPQPIHTEERANGSLSKNDVPSKSRENTEKESFLDMSRYSYSSSEQYSFSHKRENRIDEKGYRNSKEEDITNKKSNCLDASHVHSKELNLQKSNSSSPPYTTRTQCVNPPLINRPEKNTDEYKASVSSLNGRINSNHQEINGVKGENLEYRGSKKEGKTAYVDYIPLEERLIEDKISSLVKSLEEFNLKHKDEKQIENWINLFNKQAYQLCIRQTEIPVELGCVQFSELEKSPKNASKNVRKFFKF